MPPLMTCSHRTNPSFWQLGQRVWSGTAPEYTGYERTTPYGIWQAGWISLVRWRIRHHVRMLPADFFEQPCFAEVPHRVTAQQREPIAIGEQVP